MPLVHSMYMYWDVRSKVRVGIRYTEEFGVLVDVYKGSANSMMHHFARGYCISRA